MVGAGEESKNEFEGKLCESCKKPATLQCPTCLKLSLAPSFFCAQDCFKSAWGVHKLAHKLPEVDTFKYSGSLRPFPRSFTAQRAVPAEIQRPDYAASGNPNAERQKIVNQIIPVYTPEQIDLIRDCAKIAREALDVGHRAVAVGVTTEEVDRVVHEYIVSQGAYPSPLNYYKFPRSCCTSINEVICHGIPDTRPLQDGDIVNLDVSVFKHGFHSDMNETYLVGPSVAPVARELVKATYEALMKSIEYCKPGNMYRELGNIISAHVEPKGFSVVRNYVGHGTGNFFHTAPKIPHYAKNKAVGFMRPGHVFTIEPMINEGVWRDMTWNDGWTSTTTDGKRSAQFEHMILITETGHEVLSARKETSPPLEFML